MANDTVYRAKCVDCKYEWTSRKGFGTPNACPKCKSTIIKIDPMPTGSVKK